MRYHTLYMEIAILGIYDIVNKPVCRREEIVKIYDVLNSYLFIDN